MPQTLASPFSGTTPLTDIYVGLLYPHFKDKGDKAPGLHNFPTGSMNGDLKTKL